MTTRSNDDVDDDDKDDDDDDDEDDDDDVIHQHQSSRRQTWRSVQWDPMCQTRMPDNYHHFHEDQDDFDVDAVDNDHEDDDHDKDYDYDDDITCIFAKSEYIASMYQRTGYFMKSEHCLSFKSSPSFSPFKRLPSSSSSSPPPLTLLLTRRPMESPIGGNQLKAPAN